MGKNNTGHGSRYLSTATTAVQTVYSKFEKLLGGCGVGLSVIAMVLAITDEELRPYFWAYLAFAAVFAVPLYLGIRRGQRAELAKRYETIFASDRNGIVTIEELCGQTAKDPQKVLSELETLIRKGYFRDITLQRGTSTPCVIINDAMVGERGIGFVYVRCDNCGGMNHIRAGSHGSCEFCGAPIADEGAEGSAV